MAAPAAEVTVNRRPVPRLWIAAGAEIGVAAVVAVVLFGAGTTMSPGDHHSAMHANAHAPHPHWGAIIVIAAGVTAAILIWWAITRARTPAVLGAAGLIALGVSEPVRTIALRSHLVGMVVLEALLVAVPLLLITTRPSRPATVQTRSVPWTVSVIIAVMLNSALLIGLHLPGAHAEAGSLPAVPPWLGAVAVVIGLAYWAAIVRTAGHVASTVRLRALIVGQEVAAILGLAAVILPAPIMAHDTVFGLSSSTDQRLGGIVMLITCAAVTLPMARRLQPPQPAQHRRTEHKVQ